MILIHKFHLYFQESSSQLPPLPYYSSSSTPDSPPSPALGVVVSQINSSQNVTDVRETRDVLSFLDSRDIADPTTASMSWDHLTPDPSPVLDMGVLGYKESHYTPSCIKIKQPTLSHEASELNSFRNTEFFAKQYELKPYELRITPSDSIVDQIQQAESLTETEGRFYRQHEPRKSLASKSSACDIRNNFSRMADTICRNDVVIRPENIASRFDHGTNVTMQRTEESFTRVLRPSKKLFSSTENSFQKPSSATESTSILKTDSESMDCIARSPDFV